VGEARAYCSRVNAFEPEYTAGPLAASIWRMIAPPN